jgi:hypothetical protein
MLTSIPGKRSCACGIQRIVISIFIIGREYEYLLIFHANEQARPLITGQADLLISLMATSFGANGSEGWVIGL